MYEEASQVASDAIASIRTVASFTAEEKCLAAYQAKCAIPVSRAQKHGMISGLGYGSSFLMMYCTYALCFYVGARFVHDGEANFSQVFKVINFPSYNNLCAFHFFVSFSESYFEL